VREREIGDTMVQEREERRMIYGEIVKEMKERYEWWMKRLALMRYDKAERLIFISDKPSFIIHRSPSCSLDVVCM
jgi:hypothetical protein